MSMSDSRGTYVARPQSPNSEALFRLRAPEGTFKANKASNKWWFFVEGFLLCVGLTALSANVVPSAHCGPFCYIGTVTVFGNCLFAFLLLELNRRSQFSKFTSWLYGASDGRLKLYIMLTFVVLAICDLALLAISEDCSTDDSEEAKTCRREQVLDPDANGMRIRWCTRSLTAVCAVLVFLLLCSYWNLFAYYCASNAWIHSCMYLSVVGYFVLYVSRKLVSPPPTNLMRVDPFLWSWHVHHNCNTLIDNVMLLILFAVLIFVGLGALLLVAFAEASSSSQGLGTSAAVALYSVLALLMGITPLAPSTPVDACGGFLLVQLFVMNKEWSLYVAWLATLGIVIGLHFAGSCLQYWIGTTATVQRWANRSLPPELLSASDSVLRHANWFKVGMVGQVFMDTANGLNQGRMQMDFCTQFWSEYASIPSAIAWVTTGAVLAIPGLGKDTERYSWATQAVPICIMVASLWQMVASSLGASALASSALNQSFWTNREKWAIVQRYFNKVGAAATKVGWQKDVFKLRALFDAVAPIHKEYMATLATAKDGVEERVYAKQYELHRDSIRKKHCDALGITRNNCEQLFPALIVKLGSAGDFATANSTTNALLAASGKESFWSDANEVWWKRTLQLTTIFFAAILGGVCYVRIAKPVSTASAVEDGVNVLDFKDYGAWLALAVFCGIYVVYYWSRVKAGFSQCAAVTAAICTCAVCDSGDEDSEGGKDMETVFDIQHLKWSDARGLYAQSKQLVHSSAMDSNNAMEYSSESGSSPKPIEKRSTLAVSPSPRGPLSLVRDTSRANVRVSVYKPQIKEVPKRSVSVSVSIEMAAE